jgi:hypothetical protein
MKSSASRSTPISFHGEGEFRHTPDPFLCDYDVTQFQTWIRKNYTSPEDLNTAWNLYEVGFHPDPFKTWQDVNRYITAMAKEATSISDPSSVGAPSAE